MKSFAYPVRFNAAEWRILAKIAEKFAICRAEHLHMSLGSQSSLCHLASTLNGIALECETFNKLGVFWLTPYECWLLLRGERVLTENHFYDCRGPVIPWCVRCMIFPIARGYKFFNINKI